MEKSIFSESYGIFLRQLRAAREKSGLSQVELAHRLKETQSWVSKCERGERRIDIIELRTFCEAMGVSFLDFCGQLDSDLRPTAKNRRRGKARG
jgi:ribosome-binding protein aMBF1 (putative translation factor)